MIIFSTQKENVIEPFCQSKGKKYHKSFTRIRNQRDKVNIVKITEINIISKTEFDPKKITKYSG